jgi:hypothetical protein
MQRLEGGVKNKIATSKFLPPFYADVINPVRKFINPVRK